MRHTKQGYGRMMRNTSFGVEGYIFTRGRAATVIGQCRPVHAAPAVAKLATGDRHSGGECHWRTWTAVLGRRVDDRHGEQSISLMSTEDLLFKAAFQEIGIVVVITRLQPRRRVNAKQAGEKSCSDANPIFFF